MNETKTIYAGLRFPVEIISHAVWLYFRFNLSIRNIQEMLAARGVEVNHESIHFWCLKFGPRFARRPRHRQGRLGDTQNRAKESFRCVVWGDLPPESDQEPSPILDQIWALADNLTVPTKQH